MNLFLTEAEIAQLTGRKLKSRQIEWLRGSGVPFYVNAGGRPVVTRAAVVGAGDAPPVLRAWQPAVAMRPGAGRRIAAWDASPTRT
jgi:hypothetical protein